MRRSINTNLENQYLVTINAYYIQVNILLQLYSLLIIIENDISNFNVLRNKISCNNQKILMNVKYYLF